MSDFLFIYHQQLELKKELIEGRLLLIDKTNDLIIDTFIATSGLPNHQTETSLYHVGRGAIPPQSRVKIPRYTVNTQSINLKNVRGVEGNFYSIFPYSVVINGIGRGDFGIHFDANVPGSSGCVVIRNLPAWQIFEKTMQNLAAKRITGVPLLVSYSK